jgi:hypothetical protein
MTTFSAASALPTSWGERPFAHSAVGSRFTMIARLTPPSGAGVEKPGIVKSCTRMKLRP